MIPGSGRSPGEGIGCPLQYSWASLVAQLVKNPPAVGETWVKSLGWEDPLEKGTATHSSKCFGRPYDLTDPITRDPRLSIVTQAGQSECFMSCTSMIGSDMTM